ncbi:MAG: hypothetical protein HY543_03780 [Deltaproteobacteria bacterium]|nr:hypothetical protein [Deltaproteobacteria bacterium]
MAIEIAPSKTILSNDHKRRRERRRLWRLSGWGGAAALALGALAMTSQIEGGSERLQLAIAHISQPERAVALADVAPRLAETDAGTKRLEAQVLALAADRDRLVERLASLERNLDDMTGSIKRQAAVAPDAPATKIPAPAQFASPAPPIIAPLAMPAAADTATPWPSTQPAQVAAPAAVPMPPVRVAVAPSSEPAAEPPRRPELGVDLGGAPNLDVLGARWIAVKANFGPLLTGLHPRAAHDRRPGATDYRLLVGPVPNAAAATQLCARFAAARVICRPARFDGERMTQR